MRLHLRNPALWIAWLWGVAAVMLTLAMRDWDWMGDPLWGQETVGVAQVLVLPLVSGAAAAEGWRDRVTYFTFLGGGHARAKHAALVVGAWVVALTPVYVAAHAFVLVASSMTDVWVPDQSAWPLVTQVLGTCVAIGAGYAIGHGIASWAGALVAGVVVAATLVLDRLGTLTSGLAEYASSGPMMGMRADGGYFLTRAAWLILVGTASVALVVSSSLRRVAAAVLVTALLAGTLLFRSNDSYVPSERADGFCAGEVIEICGPASLAGRVSEAAAVAQPVAAALLAVGVSPPSRLVASQPAGLRHENWVNLQRGSSFRSALDPGEVIASVASPTSCEIWTSTERVPPPEWFAADRLVRSYLAMVVHRQGGLDYHQLSKRIGTEKAMSLVLEAATALQACDVTRVPTELKG